MEGKDLEDCQKKDRKGETVEKRGGRLSREKKAKMKEGL